MKNILLIAILMLLLISCRKDVSTLVKIPDCVDKEIEQIKNEKVRNPPAVIYQYNYLGNTVFYIPSYCCDVPSKLLDNRCNYLCSPDGGLTGNGDGKCTDFFSQGKLEKIVWKDTRK